MRKKDREAYLRRRARELALSGNYTRWIQIEFVLRFEEHYPEARRGLDNSYVRCELDQLCAEARIRKIEDNKSETSKTQP